MQLAELPAWFAPVYRGMEAVGRRVVLGRVGVHEKAFLIHHACSE